MIIQKKAADVVIVGMGYAGAILAKELSDLGMNVVGIERGRMQTQHDDFEQKRMYDEVKYSVRNYYAQDLSRETITFRNNKNQTALPMRRIGSFNPATGTGGSTVTYTGHMFRFLPSDLRLRSHIEERYGKKFVPDEMNLQDYAVTYEELEPFYDRFEKIAAISGKAGNLRGKIQPGGNPFEGARSNEYPLPALPRSVGGNLFAETARKMGYSPFPLPVGNASRDYVNPYNLKVNECRVCNHCGGFACTYNAKSTSTTTVLPAALKNKNFELRTDCYVTKVNTEPNGKRATGVTYIDAAGRETFQPAAMVCLAAFAYNNARLLLLSNIGKAYNPLTNEGTIGRNYAYQTITYLTGFVPGKNFNPFVAGGGIATVMDDFQGDNFDHTNLGFIGGAFIGTFNMGGLPVTNHPTVPGAQSLPTNATAGDKTAEAAPAPTWGSAWKRAVVENYQRAVGLNIHGSSQSYRGNFLDLDPTYKDAYGLPLLRMTFDFGDNDRKMSNYVTDRAVELLKAMGAIPNQILQVRRNGSYDISQYQTTHNVGGTAMGTDPRTSAVNRYLQSWDVPNLFVFGSSVFPQNSGYNPTGTVGALTYWGIDAIKNRYLKNPGALV